MNRLSEIISNALDMSGGSNPAINLPVNAATLHALNILADMELELNSSSAGLSGLKFRKSFSFGGRTGAIDRIPNYIRVRRGQFSSWQIIDVVSDIEDLSQAENENRMAILIYGSPGDLSYQLSFDPSGICETECWGAVENTGESQTLDGIVKLPENFTQLAAVRTALILLDDLLLMPGNPQMMMAFVQNRRASLMLRLRDLKHWWTVYRSNAVNSGSDRQVQPYDPFQDYGTVFGDNYSGNGFWD